MCLGTSHNVPPCLPPEPWSPPLACRYTYNPVLHTVGGITGVIIGSAVALAIVFYVSRKLISRIWLILAGRCLRNRRLRNRLPSRLSRLFLEAGYSVPNENDIHLRSVGTSTGDTTTPVFNLNRSFLDELSDSRV